MIQRTDWAKQTTPKHMLIETLQQLSDEVLKFQERMASGKLELEQPKPKNEFKPGKHYQADVARESVTIVELLNEANNSRVELQQLNVQKEAMAVIEYLEKATLNAKTADGAVLAEHVYGEVFLSQLEKAKESLNEVKLAYKMELGK